MEFKRFDALLQKGADELAVEIGDQQSGRLYDYFSELKRWSRKVNLVSRNASDEEIVEKHFLDSLVLLDLLREPNASLLDVGSGAGFPGLVCKTARPGLPVALVEPRLKRVSFLRHICRLLDLSDVEVHGRRLEEGIIEGESAFTWVVSRAVAEIGDFLALCGRFREYGSSVVCMKGPGYLEELDAMSEAEEGWYLIDTKAYRLPYSGAQRALLVFKGVQAPTNHSDTSAQEKEK